MSSIEIIATFEAPDVTIHDQVNGSIPFPYNFTRVSKRLSIIYLLPRAAPHPYVLSHPFPAYFLARMTGDGAYYLLLDFEEEDE